jgi:hypothetical protein
MRQVWGWGLLYFGLLTVEYKSVEVAKAKKATVIMDIFIIATSR